MNRHGYNETERHATGLRPTTSRARPGERGHEGSCHGTRSSEKARSSSCAQRPGGERLPTRRSPGPSFFLLTVIGWRANLVGVVDGRSATISNWTAQRCPKIEAPAAPSDFQPGEKTPGEGQQGAHQQGHPATMACRLLAAPLPAWGSSGRVGKSGYGLQAETWKLWHGRRALAPQEANSTDEAERGTGAPSDRRSWLRRKTGGERGSFRGFALAYGLRLPRSAHRRSKEDPVVLVEASEGATRAGGLRWELFVFKRGLAL
jgi:hypothetical protein